MIILTCKHNYVKNLEQKYLIFIFSNAGVSRSSTVVIAYIMHTKKLSLDKVFHLIKQARPSVKPNDGFWRQLKEYDTIYHAE